MIPFFRKIRSTLIESGKVRKYSLYALGEISLVVVGILIALQINNWNLSQIDRKTEKSICTNLLSNLKVDLDNINFSLSNVEKGIEMQQLIKNHSFESFVDNHTSVEIYEILNALSFVSISFFPNYGMYEQITSSNQIQLIQSDEIRSAVIELYDGHYKRYEHVDQTVEQKWMYGLQVLLTAEIGMEIKLYKNQGVNSYVDIEKLHLNYDLLQKGCRDIGYVSETTRVNLAQTREYVVDLIKMLEYHLTQ